MTTEALIAFLIISILCVWQTYQLDRLLILYKRYVKFTKDVEESSNKLIESKEAVIEAYKDMIQNLEKIKEGQEKMIGGLARENNVLTVENNKLISQLKKANLTLNAVSNKPTQVE